jgi:hypothetical protein
MSGLARGARGRRAGAQPASHWDTVFAQAPGRDASDIARRLITAIEARDVQAWSEGSAADWLC